MSSAGVEVSPTAKAMGPEESSNLDGSDVEMVEEEPKNGEHDDEEVENEEDNEEELGEPKENEDSAAGLNDSIVISDSENEDLTNNINKETKAEDEEEDDDEDVITITANDGSLGRGHTIAPKPNLAQNDEEDDDNEVELLDDDDDDDDNNSVQALPNGQDEDALLEDSSLDNSRVFNDMDSSLSNDNSLGEKPDGKGADDDDDVMLISDEEESLTSLAAKHSRGSARSSANLNSAHTSFLAKSGITIEAVRGGRDGIFKSGRKRRDQDVVELEDGDPLAGCESDEDDDNSSQGDGDDPEPFVINGESNDSESKANHTTIVVNDTKSLVELANSKKEPGKEPTLVIIDTNSILSGKGPLPMNNNNNKAAAPQQQQQQQVNSSQMNNSSNRSSNSNRANSSQSSRQVSNNNNNNTSAGAQSIDIPDDAFLIEAPSFIVPYVFEKAGEKSLKECISEIAAKVKEEKEAKLARGEELTKADEIQEPKKINSEEYFESPVGKLLMNIGMNMVQEYVQIDLLKMQKRQGEKEKIKNRSGMMSQLTTQSILSLKRNIEESKENNEPFKSKTKKCELCNFKTESELVMSTHLETPHMKNYSYRCNFCTNTTRVPQEIIFHMEAEHNVKARLERAPAYHQCPNCQFEDNSKAKLNRHIQGCTKRFNINKNLEPPMDWDTPAKLPKLPKNRMIQQGMNPNYLTANHQRGGLAAFASLAPKYMPNTKGGLPQLIQAPKNKPIPGLIRTTNPRSIQSPIANSHMQRGMMMQRGGMQGIQQAHMQLTNNQMLQQVVSGQLLGAAQGVATGFLNKLGLQPMQTGPNASQQKSASQQSMRAKSSNQPSISITPLPRQAASSSASAASQQKPAGKTSFVICEICDGYIKDLDQLRNHMQWIHKVKIHPKMIYNKPPLNCQKCQFRFFTDQGLERHLLGSHGLVTSSMQDAANKGQDSGRCPLCGKVYQWKLLAHVAKDHNVTLKPAHLSYKCTVCTATFGMYKLFESHVYSAHSVTKNAPRPERRAIGNQQQIPNKMSQLQVTPRTMPMNASSNSYKPLKINDEITIIPQPMANASLAHRNKGSLTITPQPLPRRNMRNNDDDGIQIIEIDEAPQKMSSNGRSSNQQNGDFKGRFQMSETLRKRNLEISLCGTDSDNSDDSRGPPIKRLRQN